MALNKPFHRNYREIMDSANSGYSAWGYIIDHDYAKSPEHYTRAFLLIQNDLQKLFEYIEPADVNLKTYSYRIHELFMRTCIEIEANFKAIFEENAYSKNGNWNIRDYKLIDVTHHLSSYTIEIPIWSGSNSIFAPFKEWKTGGSLKWYQDYNASKHDRQKEFCRANFENLLNAITGLLILLSSQFRKEDFSTGSRGLAIGGYDYYSGEPGIGGFFRITFPIDWSDDEKYDFDWSVLKQDNDRFYKVDYDKI